MTQSFSKYEPFVFKTCNVCGRLYNLTWRARQQKDVAYHNRLKHCRCGSEKCQNAVAQRSQKK